ncbi:MAG: aspartate ammonia-lyase [Candidatus Micrarchaeota archaeon]|nr:aspartate ammonia-lyase [Candidatus Micrarchaeota archaeon]
MLSIRIEKDFLGSVKVPDDVYWGVFTKRAKENFNLTDRTARPVFIHALGFIKWSAAQVHEELKQLPPDKAKAIQRAAQEVASGKHDSQFPLDAITAGAGTPFNMNANEVIANRALELMGRKRGDYDFIHPNNDVNKSQSTNDVVPTAIRLAVLIEHPRLESAVYGLEAAFQKKAIQYKHVVQTGRTHLQDAVPVTLEQVFGAYARALYHDRHELSFATARLRELGIGGTAVGTGINTHPEFRKRMVARLSSNTGLELHPGVSPVELTSNMNAFLEYAGAMGQIATTIHRISNDLKLLSSGPRAGVGELRLPEVEPGSSIMPGKINPSIPEAAEMAALQVLSRIWAVEAACRSGQLQLNVLTPLISDNLLSAQNLLIRTAEMLSSKCVEGIFVDEPRTHNQLMSGLMVATALAPILGYAQVSELIKEADKRGVPIQTVILEKKLFSKEELGRLLEPTKLTGPNLK